MLPIPTPSQRDLNRFHSGYSISDSGCWNWHRSTVGAGYGRMLVQGKLIRAHRLSFAIHNKIDPLPFLVCHSCDNPACVNPAHLWRGTVLDNTRDMLSKGRHSRQQKSTTGCIRCGHDRSDDYVDRRGGRRCRNCQKIRDAASK